MPGSDRFWGPLAGADHPRVRQFLNIKHNRSKVHDGALALEGLWIIRHALAARLPVEAVFVCPPLWRGDDTEHAVNELRNRGAAVFAVSEKVMRRMVDRDGPDGLAAVVYGRPFELGDIPVGETTRVVVADGFELAGNLGTIVRCADGAGTAGVLLTDRRIRLSHPLVLKASMGTALSMPMVDVDRGCATQWLRDHRFRIVAADPGATTSYRDADYSARVAIVLGSERYGLAPFWREVADVTVSIPMLGRADSLNVGHAAALLLYEALHQSPGRSEERLLEPGTRRLIE